MVASIGLDGADRVEIARHHLFDQIVKAHSVLPAELSAGLRSIAAQDVNFRRPEVTRIDADQNLAVRLVDTDFVDALAMPPDAPADDRKGALAELPHGVRLSGGEHVIVGLRLLQDRPHAFDVVARMAPIALGVQIADEQRILPPGLDRGHRLVKSCG